MYSSRRRFIQTAALFPLVLNNLQAPIKGKARLAFSTLGCPDWSFDQVLDFAAAHGYDGIELRGIQRELDLTKRPEFSDDTIEETKKRVRRKGLKIVDLGSSATLHYTEEDKRQEQIDKGKEFIDLAERLGCPYVRVFPNNLPKGEDKEKIMELIADGLRELGEYAKKGDVTVIIESHGDLVWADDIKKVLDAANHSHVGLLWDMVNMWSITREPPKEVYAKLKPYIRHTHFKDITFMDGKIKYVLFGTGEAPLTEAIEALEQSGYKGFYSFEWEKLWHPELEDPQIALAQFPNQFLKLYRR